METGQLTVTRRTASVSAIGAAGEMVPQVTVRGPSWDGRLTVLILFLPPALLLFTLFVVLPIGKAA